ncbi:hypothetical protein AVEN_77892-1 [Araneus ventricosus]|uniref:Uncharacterized protein n=1 Tax=Araneus ventricosus TaxID=182803 RepID=A0A4Y2RJ87_ARAVE|nr:hypothetical protein AVEN_77892-1 [Araneus ventricosus]
MISFFFRGGTNSETLILSFTTAPHHTIQFLVHFSVIHTVPRQAIPFSVHFSAIHERSMQLFHFQSISQSFTTTPCNSPIFSPFLSHSRTYYYAGYSLFSQFLCHSRSLHTRLFPFQPISQSFTKAPCNAIPFSAHFSVIHDRSIQRYSLFSPFISHSRQHPATQIHPLPITPISSVNHVPQVSSSPHTYILLPVLIYSPAVQTERWTTNLQIPLHSVHLSVIHDSTLQRKSIHYQSLRFPNPSFSDFLGEPRTPSLLLSSHVHTAASVDLWPGSPNGAMENQSSFHPAPILSGFSP